MATSERTMSHPYGGDIHIGAVDETYSHPYAGNVQSDITIEGATGGIVRSMVASGGTAAHGGLAGIGGGLAG